MKETLYIMTGNFSLAKHGDAIEFTAPDAEHEGQKCTRIIPTAMLDSIELYGNAQVTTPVLQFCNEIGIPCYFNTYNGIPVGVFIPESSHSSIVKLKQYATFIDPNKKLHVAKAIVMKASNERRRIIEKYDKKEMVTEIKNEIKKLMENISSVQDVETLRGIEGNIMKSFFGGFSKLLFHLPFDGRSKQPPLDEGNAILGWGNVILYNTVRNEIFKVALDPQVGFLHEPHENRASLAIDIAEIFRPIIVDNLILRLDHKRTLLPVHFDKDEIKCYLNQQGKRIWIREYFDFLHGTIDYPPLQRKISVKEEIRLEGYNLIKYITGEKDEYIPIDFKNT
nr:CRISPR-associated endonuclease Cas1 [Candidatus Sigynarchaeota archaeon]